MATMTRANSQLMVNFEYLGGWAHHGTVRSLGTWTRWGRSILLNGERVGQVPLTMRRWVYGLKLVLPEAS